MPNLDKDFYLDKQGLRQLVNELETNIVASEYDTSVSYSVGQYCIYENNFYRCTIATTGTWDSTAWVKVIISDEIPSIQSITTAQWEALTPEQKASGDYVITDATTVPLTAANVPYDGASTTSVKDVLDLLLDRIYPVGSIYMSVTDSTVASVQARFGGTWERISEGKALFGYSSTDADFQTIGTGGGNKVIDLSHSHTVNSHSHTIDNQSGLTGSHKLTANESGIQSHAHTFSQKPTYKVTATQSGVSITGGSHQHTSGLTSAIYGKPYQQFGAAAVASGSNYTVPCRDGDRSWGGDTSSNTHTHTLPSHTHTISEDKAPSLNNTSGDAKSGHAHSIPKSTDSSSPGTNSQLSNATNILNPYITVYMYKRTA